MDKQLILLRDISSAMWVIVGAALVTYGYWGLAAIVPALAFQMWLNGKIDHLIETAMKLALRNAAKLYDE